MENALLPGNEFGLPEWTEVEEERVEAWCCYARGHGDDHRAALHDDVNDALADQSVSKFLGREAFPGERLKDQPIASCPGRREVARSRNQHELFRENCSSAIDLRSYRSDTPCADFEGFIGARLIRAR